jgi:hypothetical protein
MIAPRLPPGWVTHARLCGFAGTTLQNRPRDQVPGLLPLLQCVYLSLYAILKKSGRYPVDSTDMIAKKFRKHRANETAKAGSIAPGNSFAALIELRKKVLVLPDVAVKDRDSHGPHEFLLTAEMGARLGLDFHEQFRQSRFARLTCPEQHRVEMGVIFIHEGNAKYVDGQGHAGTTSKGTNEPIMPWHAGRGLDLG